jgi:riboflavin synthase
MFSGIVDHCGIITDIKKSDNALTIAIKCAFTELQAGESIAVDGICLTVTDPQSQLFRCDLSPETCRLTTAKHFQKNQEVNLERALRLSDRFGGHIVMGHVDQQATVKTIQRENEFIDITFSGLDEYALRYVMKKGSIAVNGVSLTVNELLPNGFQVMLIPHTLEIANLKHLKSGSAVNLEFDWMARVIVRQFESIQSSK